MRFTASTILAFSILCCFNQALEASHDAYRLFCSSSSGGSGNPSSLYEVDINNGDHTLVGAIGFNRVGAMATHPTSGIIYATSERNGTDVPVLITIDHETGVGTEVGATGIPGNITDIEFRTDGTLFAHLQKGGGIITEMYTINTSTGAASILGATGQEGGGGGLAMTRTDSLMLQLSGPGFTDAFVVNQGSGVASHFQFLNFTLGFAAKAMKYHPQRNRLYAIVNTKLGPVGSGSAPKADLQIINLVTGNTTRIDTTFGELDGMAFVFDPPPDVQVINPDGGEQLQAGSTVDIEWIATDNGSVTSVDIAFSTGVKLFATSSGKAGPSRFYEIDPASGDTTFIGNTGFYKIGAMDQHPGTGVIYGTAERTELGVPILITIDPATGIGTEVGPTGTNSLFTDLAFRPTDNTLFGMKVGGTLWYFDLGIGEASFVGISGLAVFGGGLEFSEDNQLILQSGEILAPPWNTYELDQLTGENTNIGPVNFPSAFTARGRYAALDRHPVFDQMIAIAKNGHLPTTSTHIGDAGPAGRIFTIIGDLENYMDGLVWALTPCISIATGEANDGMYTWVVPDSLTNQGIVKITAHDDRGQEGTSLSDQFFSIVPNPLSVTVLAPNGGEELAPGSTFKIQWDASTTAGSILGVEIHFATGLKLYGSSSDGNAGVQSFLFEIDPATGDTTRIGPIGFNRVGAMAQHPAAPAIYATAQRIGDSRPVLITIDLETGAGFEIGTHDAGGADITGLAFRPSTNQLYGMGLEGFVFIFDTNTAATVNLGQTGFSHRGGGLEFANDDLIIYSTAVREDPPWELYQVDANTGEASFSAEIEFPSQFTDWARLSSMDFNPFSEEIYAIGKNDRSPTTLTMVGKISPSGPLVFQGIANVHNTMDGIVWAYDNFEAIAFGTPNDGEFDWLVPATITDQGIIIVNAVGSLGTERTDLNDDYFAIRSSPPEVTVLSPNGGEVFAPGANPEIQWVATDNVGVTSVDIAYVVDVIGYATTTDDGPLVPSDFYTINLDTEITTLVDDIGFNRVGALAADTRTGILYAAGVRRSDLTPVLITIDPVTGIGTEVGPTGTESNITDLAFDRLTNQLYGHRRDKTGAFPTELLTFDVTSGAASVFGLTNRQGGGGALAFSLSNRLRLALRLTPDSWLHNVNKTTGSVFTSIPLSFMSPYDRFEVIKAMDFHPLHGLLYGIGGDFAGETQGLLLINTATGSVDGVIGTSTFLDGFTFGPGVCIPIANGEPNDGSYTWTVPNTPTPMGRVKVTAHDGDGNTWTDMSDAFFVIGNTTDVEEKEPVHTTYLSAASPNPFRDATTIRFSLARPGRARLAIYDARGRLTRELVSGTQEAGPQVIQWDGRDHAGRSVASGIYVLRLEANGQMMNRRLSLIR